MNKITRKISLIFLFLLSLFLFDRIFTYIILEYNHHFYSSNDLENRLRDHLKENKYNSLIMGSSRTYEGIHPKLIKNDKLNPFKWSFAGFGPKYNFYFYKLYKKLAGKPKVILYGIDYFIYNLYSSPEALSELNIGNDLTPNIDYLQPGILLLKNKGKIDIIFKDILRTFQPSGQSLLEDINIFQSYTGTKKSELKNNKVFTDVTKRFSRAAFTKPPGIEGDYFFRFLEELRNDKVKLVLIVIPEFIGTFKTNIFKGTFKKYLNKLRRKYRNITILNYNMKKKFDLGNVTLFLDGGYGFTNSHLSKKGSEIFNKMLSDNLKILKY